MDENTPYMPYADCVEYLKSNSWQLKMLGPQDSVRVSANFLRSCLHYMDDPPNKKLTPEPVTELSGG